MTEFESLPPDPDLFESMRAVGYSLETAVADLIDNSIAARATEIKVGFTLVPKSQVYILDDGIGMDRSELRTAMKLAGKPPTLKREVTDLGRFGLGLKTASLSQARRLVVISKKSSGMVVGAVWDLDEISKRGEWSLEWLGSSEIETYLAQVELSEFSSGTVVIWEKLDHLIGLQEHKSTHLAERMASTKDHLALVFHRYLSGSPKDTIRIFLNDEKIIAIDPFFTKNTATQIKKQRVSVHGTDIEVTAYVLPNLNRMSPDELAQSKKMNSRFRETQGFYIYRQKRLLMFGTWFRLAPRSELSKLSRIQVDTPNTLDTQWKLGVTKSQVEPPEILKRALANIVPSIVNESQKVLGKGTKSAKKNSTDVDTFWNFDAVSADTFNLLLNRNNAVLQSLTSGLSQEKISALEAYLNSIEQNFPTKELYSRMVGDEVPVKTVHNKSEILNQAKTIYEVLKLGGNDESSCFSALVQMEPFGLDPLVQSLLVEHRKFIMNVE